MHNVSDSFSIDIAAEQQKLIELYTVALPDGNTYYYTSGPDNFAWNGNTYVSAPIRRGERTSNLNFETDSVEIEVGGISGDLVDVVEKNILDSADVTIVRVRADDSIYAANKQLILFKGTVDVRFDRQTLRLQARSIFDSLNLVVPRCIYEECCNYRVFDLNCQLVIGDYEYTGRIPLGAAGTDEVTIAATEMGAVYKVAFDAGDEDAPVERNDALSGGTGAGTGECVQIVYLTAATGFIWYVEQDGAQYVDDEVLTGGGNTVTVNGTPAEDTTFYEHGEIEYTSGNNDGQIRPILTAAAGIITVAWPFTNVPTQFNTFTMRPGCDLTSDVCRDRFNNAINFRGFLYIPKTEEVLM